MKKIIFSLSLVFGMAALIVGVTISYFADSEISEDNSFTTGTVDIEINDQNPWIEKMTVGEMLPGETKEFTFNIKNVGTNPVRIWQILENVEGLENGVSDTEQDWYDDNDVDEKNDVDSAMDFEMFVDGNMVVNKEAEFSLADIKNRYLNLVKLDQPFEENNGDGILYPGKTIVVEHSYFFNPIKAENWAQSDQLSFDIRILAKQLDSPEPVKLMSFMDNKYPGWNSTIDERIGVLKYDSIGDDFNYNFIGKNLPAGNYKLIYYPDPWSNSKTIFLLSDVLNSDGKMLVSGDISFDLEIDLPNISDDNIGYGAKVWLVPTTALNGDKLNWSPSSNWLFDSWPGLINYEQGTAPAEEPASTEGTSTGGSVTTSTQSIQIDEVLSVTDWTGEARNYSSANVNFSYQSPADNQLSGIVTASGLKPFTTYQMKFIGKPTCDGAGGNDVANEYIGYQGRWTVLNSSCSGAGCNRTDAQYEANKSSGGECIAGYLVWDFFTTDANGVATKSVATDCSYHVLWCNGGVCGSADNSQLKYEPATGLDYHYCEAGDVEGEIERGVCNELNLDSGEYDLKMVLTEESFHQTEGVWTTVLEKDINFTIN